jgi:hypothetical protein
MELKDVVSIKVVNDKIVVSNPFNGIESHLTYGGVPYHDFVPNPFNGIERLRSWPWKHGMPRCGESIQWN